jgi:hypothetical protein
VLTGTVRSLIVTRMARNLYAVSSARILLSLSIQVPRTATIIPPGPPTIAQRHLEFLSDRVDDRFGRSAIISASAQESGTLPISFKRPQATDTMRADEPATAECSHGSWPSFAMQAWYQSVRSLPNSMSPETG